MIKLDEVGGEEGLFVDETMVHFKLYHIRQSRAIVASRRRLLCCHRRMGHGY
jgi:hypothetical protein